MSGRLVCRIGTQVWQQRLLAAKSPCNGAHLPLTSRSRSMHSMAQSSSGPGFWSRHKVLGPAAVMTAAGAAMLTYDQFSDTETRPQWMKPASIMDAAKVASVTAWRFFKCFSTVAEISFDYKWSMRGIKEGTDEYEQEIKKVHERCAQRMVSLFLYNGGVFIKAGQQLYALDYLLPDEYWMAMKPCLGEVPHNEWSDVERLVHGELGASVWDLFVRFDKKPIAAASLAQVHHAVTKDGREVAVKVQYPDLLAKVKGDLWTIEKLLEFVEYLFPEFKLGWLAREFNVNLPKELDFTREARNSERTRRNMEAFDGVTTPTIYWDLTTRRVLSMEFIDGVYVNNLEGMASRGINKDKVAMLVCNCFSKQIFIDGFVHCDPHPGNVLTRRRDKDGAVEIVLLDHGLYREISDSFRMAYARMWRGVLQYDKEAIAEAVREMKVDDCNVELLACMLTSRDWVSKEENAEVLDGDIPADEVAKIQKFGQTYMYDIAGLLSRLPEEMLLLFKCNDLVRSLHRQLKTKVNIFSTMADWCIYAIERDAIVHDPSLWTFFRASASSFATRVRVFFLSLYLWFIGEEI